MKDFFAEIMP